MCGTSYMEWTVTLDRCGHPEIHHRGVAAQRWLLSSPCSVSCFWYWAFQAFAVCSSSFSLAIMVACSRALDMASHNCSASL